jgi:hypothetical protein
LPSNRRRGFHYERLAAKRISSLLAQYSKESETWWAYRIPLSAGVMVVRNGNRLYLPGDVIVGCCGYGVQTIEVKSLAKLSKINRILKFVRCPFLMVHQHRSWHYWYRSTVPACNGHPNGWHQVGEKEFVRRLMEDIRRYKDKDNHDVVLIAGLQQ